MEKDKIKLISFEKEDYLEIFQCILEVMKLKILLVAILLFAIFFYGIVFLMTKDYRFSLTILWVLMGIPLIVMIYGEYLSFINKFKKNMWGIGFIPPVSFYLSHKFFNYVSFDRTFVIMASVISMILISKWLIRIAKEL